MILRFLLALFVLSPILLASNNFAATKTLPAPTKNYAKSGQPVKTKYFSVTLPSGWVMPEQIKSRQGGLTCVFLHPKSMNTVNLSIFDIPEKTDKFAKYVADTMKKSGLKTGKLEKVGALYRIPINDKAKGEGWFACDGKTCVSSVILGEKLDKGAVNSFLSAFRPVSQTIFPKKMK